jgi:hypothetical protein
MPNPRLPSKGPPAPYNTALREDALSLVTQRRDVKSYYGDGGFGALGDEALCLGIGSARMERKVKHEISRLLLNFEKRSYALLAKKLQFSRQVAGEIWYALGIEQQDKIILVSPID